MPNRQIYENYIIYDFVGEKFNRTETIAIAKKQNIGTNRDRLFYRSRQQLHYIIEFGK